MATRTLIALEEIGNPSPTNHGLVGWTFDPVATNAGLVPAASYIYLWRVVAVQDASITKVIFEITSQGGGLTAAQNFAGLYDAAGNRLGITADQSAAWTTGGVKEMSLTASAAVTRGTPYYVAAVSNGTTTPTLLRGSFSDAIGYNLATSTLRFASGAAGLTTLPSTSAPAGWSVNANAVWAAIR